MNTTMHQFKVNLHRKGNDEPIDGGEITFHGEDYHGFTEAEALPRILPGGDHADTLDVSLPGFVRWRGILMPAAEFERLELQLVAMSKPG